MQATGAPQFSLGRRILPGPELTTCASAATVVAPGRPNTVRTLRLRGPAIAFCSAAPKHAKLTADRHSAISSNQPASGLDR